MKAEMGLCNRRCLSQLCLIWITGCDFIKPVKTPLLSGVLGDDNPTVFLHLLSSSHACFVLVPSLLKAPSYIYLSFFNYIWRTWK